MRISIFSYCALALLLSVSCNQPHNFHVPSGSMEETIKRGQNVVVTRTDKFERNDIVTFDLYGPDYSSSPDPETGERKQVWSKRIYRLIAMSGDSVQISEGEVFVNGHHVPLPSTGKLLFHVNAKGPIDELNDDPSGMTTSVMVGDTLQYTVSLTRSEAENLASRKPFVMAVNRVHSPTIANDSDYARAASTGKWNVDDYGPFKIPSPGDQIIVNRDNWKFFQNIPGIQEGVNVINEKLYFLLGDNRYAAQDSRFIGLIAYSKMYGVVK